MLTAAEIIDRLGLRPLPQEGGYFRETYRSPALTHTGAGSAGPRSLATAIYFLLTSEAPSALHRLPGDELYHHYAGAAVELLLLEPDGLGRTVVLGSDLAAGQRPQVRVPGGVWQGARVVAGSDWALLGTTMSPGFDYSDFELGRGAELRTAYPDCAALIGALSRD